MSIRLDYVPKSKPYKTCQWCKVSFRPPSGHPKTKFCSRACAGQHITKHRKRKACRTMICLVCEKEFRPSWYGRKTCSRACAHIRGSPRQQKIAPVRAPSGMVDPKASTACASCGGQLQFRFDFLGRSLEECVRCGERPVQIYGQRKYDQRQRLEEELVGKVSTAQEPIAQERSPYVGDTFRQTTHRKAG